MLFPVSPFVHKAKQLCLHRDDFEILKVIGRGAFGEVSTVEPRSPSFAVPCLSSKWDLSGYAKLCPRVKGYPAAEGGDPRKMSTRGASFLNGIDSCQLQGVPH